MPTIKFDLREIPHAEDRKLLGYYPVVASPQTLSARSLCETISHRCTANAADVAAVLTALAEVVTEQLRGGNRVEVPELGSFAPTLGSEERITDPADTQIARRLKIAGIGFTPKRSLKNDLTDVTFHRVEDAGRSSVPLTKEDVKARIKSYLTTQGNAALDRAALEKLVGCRRSKAAIMLRTLTSEGFLKKGGKENSPYYTLAE